MDIGQKLRQKRESLNKTLTDIHDQTRISVEHLQFLEQNNFSFLPETYVRAFLKDYAHALGLDVDELQNTLSADEVDSRDPKQAENVEGSKRARSATQNPRILEISLVLGAVALLIGIALTYLQYRTQVNGKSPARPATFSRANLATGSDKGDGNAAAFELRINTSEPITLQLSIDDAQVIERVLSEQEKIIKLNDTEFEILIKDPKGLNFDFKNEELAKAIASGKPVRLTFKRESSNGKH